jgi:hypothetical protein
VDPRDAGAVNLALRHAVLDTYFFQPRREAIVRELAANEARYREAAEGWLTRLSQSDWTKAIPPQGWVARGGEPPSAEKFQSANGYWSNAVWRPPRGGFWTSTVTARSTPWLDLLGPDTDRLWILDVNPSVGAPRVLEVGAPDDWRSLVTAYPLKVETGPIVAGSVAKLPPYPFTCPIGDASLMIGMRFASPCGEKLRSLYVIAPVDDGFTLVHGEEALEETLWLRWVFSDPIVARDDSTA